MKNKRGFTLIELLVVVLIIGILSAIALPQYETARDKSKFSTILDLTNSLADANQRFFLANGEYTADVDNLDISIPYNSITKSGTSSSMTFDWGSCAMSKVLSVCSLTMPTVRYIVNYQPVIYGQHACLVLPGDKRAAKVCQGYAGRDTPNYSASNNDYYWVSDE